MSSLTLAPVSSPMACIAASASVRTASGVKPVCIASCAAEKNSLRTPSGNLLLVTTPL